MNCPQRLRDNARGNGTSVTSHFECGLIFSKRGPDWVGFASKKFPARNSCRHDAAEVRINSRSRWGESSRSDVTTKSAWASISGVRPVLASPTAFIPAR